jgi:hypothetical protein
MTNILIISVFIIVITLLFWLDRKGKDEKSKAERIYNEIFKIFNSIRWGMPLGELRELFSEKEFVTSEESSQVMGTGYIDKLDGLDIFVSFYFPKGGEDKLIRADFYLLNMPLKEFNLVFSKFNEKHGTPFAQIGDKQKSGSWDLGNSLLTLEETDEKEFQIQIWSKEFYNKSNEEIME